jgi:hypothetical protein
LKGNGAPDHAVVHGIRRLAICSIEGKRVGTAVRSREILMSLFLTPSFDTSLCQGGVGGVNYSEAGPCQSLLFTPMPCGTDTACPADRL